MQISARYDHFAVLRENGTAICHSENRDCECYVPLNPDGSEKKFVKIQVGNGFTIGVTAEGEYEYWGGIDEDGEWDNYKDFSMNRMAIVVLKQDNTVEVIGDLDYEIHPLMNCFGEFSVIERISTTRNYAVGLNIHGHILWWGLYMVKILKMRVDDDGNEVIDFPQGTFIDISAGDDCVLALKPNGHVKEFRNSDNHRSPSIIPTNKDGTKIKFVSVSAGRNYSMGITEGGDILSWGDSPFDANEIKHLLKDGKMVKSANKR